MPTKKTKKNTHFEHILTMARMGRYEEEVLYKAGVGQTATVRSVELSGCASS
jgi:hypothetical protein